MSQDFYRKILNRHANADPIPSNAVIAAWAIDLMGSLYPQQIKKDFKNTEEIATYFTGLKQRLLQLLQDTKACESCDLQKVADTFFDDLPLLCQALNKDAHAITEGDPAARDEYEVIRTYPGFLAISFYRIAHKLFELDIPLIPRILTEYAHSKTGIDIHPGAQIGAYFFIDHGTGIVIGETTEIGNYVKLYQGVNLGALSVEKDMQNTKRHPTIEDHVIIYSGATILGGETVVGEGSIIGGNVWLVKSVPKQSKVYHTPTINVIQKVEQD